MNRARRLFSLLPLTAVAVTTLLAACSDSNSLAENDPGIAANSGSTQTMVVPPGERVFGRSYGEWTAAWWQWAYGIPVPSNPLFDETGSLCSSGQSGPVWFLAGVFNATGTAVRNACVVPAGKVLLVPVLNGECSNVEGNGTTEAEWRACAAAQMDLAVDVAANLDGAPVPDIASYRVQSPRAYRLTLPDNNILQLFGYDAPAGSCMPTGPGCTRYRSFADGYYVMLAPPSPGPHTIHVHGAIPTFGFTLDVTYHLKVQSPGRDSH